MNYRSLKKAIIISVVAFCFFLVISAIQYAIGSNVSEIVYKLIGLTVAYAIVFSIHFWSTAYLNVTGFQKLLLSILNIEIFLTLIILIPLIFGWFDFVRMLVIFSSLQLVHGAIYLCNMFLYDEKPVQKTTLSEREILKKSKTNPINPSIQEYGGNESD